jgi:site-specific DNA-methyltransferase (adenine-specific)
VCYFLWEKQYTGDCEFTVMVDGTVISTATRDLRAGGDVILRAALAADILEKVQFVGQPTMEVQVSARKPFGMATNFTNHSTRKSKDALKLYGNHFTAWVKPEFITKNSDWVAKYKVIVPRVGGGEGRFPDVAIGRPLLLGPNEVCTETYLVAGVFDSQNEAESLLSYLGTRLVRLLISLRKPTPDTNSSKFTFVPVTTWDKTWTDAELYRIYGISTDEADFIEQMITEVP